jgi:hypothetical protein
MCVCGFILLSLLHNRNIANLEYCSDRFPHELSPVAGHLWSRRHIRRVSRSARRRHGTVSHYHNSADTDAFCICNFQVACFIFHRFRFLRPLNFLMCIVRPQVRSIPTVSRVACFNTPKVFYSLVHASSHSPSVSRRVVCRTIVHLAFNYCSIHLTSPSLSLLSTTFAFSTLTVSHVITAALPGPFGLHPPRVATIVFNSLQVSHLHIIS